MAEFSRLIITKKGQALIAKVLAGTVADVEFTKVAASKASYTMDELEWLSALPEIMQEAEISYKARTNDVAVVIETAFSNTKLTVGYPMNTLGLFAIDPDEGEILYAACAEISGYCYMPPYNGITVSGAYIQLVTTVGNADNISLEVNPAAAATFADIQRLQKQIEAYSTNVRAISLTVPAAGWATSGIAAYPYTVDVANKAIHEYHYPQVTLDTANLPIASACGLCSSVLAVEGAIRFWAEKTPAADMSVSVLLLCSGRAGEGGTIPIATANSAGIIKGSDSIIIDPDGTAHVKLGADNFASDTEVKAILDEVYGTEDTGK